MMAWMNRHPDLSTWIALAIGMLAALTWSARDEGLAAMQWAWLALAVTGVAGLCAWIISWEADSHDDGGPWEDFAAGHGMAESQAAQKDVDTSDGSAPVATTGALE